jgi:hypothetical protein
MNQLEYLTIAAGAGILVIVAVATMRMIGVM